MRGNVWATIGLIALAAATAFLVILSFLNVRPEVAAPAAAEPRLATRAPEPTQSIAQTPSAEPAQSAGPGQTAAPSPGATEQPPRASTLVNIRQTLNGADPVKILVLGDATGRDDKSSGTDRWVTLWAKSLAEKRPVTVAELQATGEYSTPQRFGSGTKAAIEILNASDFPNQISAATAKADTLIPADVDLVVINFGHTEPPANLTRDLDALWAKLPANAMGLVIAQNPQRGPGAVDQRTRAQAVTAWAQNKQIPLVDVYNAFIAAPEPLVELLGDDQINPNARGSEVWRNAVVAALP